MRRARGVKWSEDRYVVARGRQKASTLSKEPNGITVPTLINPKKPRRLRKKTAAHPV